MRLLLLGPRLLCDPQQILVFLPDRASDHIGTAILCLFASRYLSAALCFVAVVRSRRAIQVDSYSVLRLQLCSIAQSLSRLAPTCNDLLVSRPDVVAREPRQL